MLEIFKTVGAAEAPRAMMKGWTLSAHRTALLYGMYSSAGLVSSHAH